MNQAKKKVSALRVGIIASLIVAVLQIILIGGTYLRRNAVGKIEADIQQLDKNLAQLDEVNQEQLDALEEELDSIEAEILELQASFPELGAPFALIRRAEEFSKNNQVDLSSISKSSPDLYDTASGKIIIEEYNVELLGSFRNCIDFIGQVEDAGLDSVIMQSASYFQEDQLCSLDIQTLGITSIIDD